MKKEEFYREAISDCKGALEGLRVLETTTALAGPIAGTILGDMGAEVIKIDPPGIGEMARHIPPFVKGGPEVENAGLYLSIHRNKKNITLDLKSPKGQEIYRAIAQKMDIVVENFKPGTLEKWGLGYQDIKHINPSIIYVSISGFGQYGPLHYKPGYDHIGQAMGGLMSITGYPDGPPTRTGNGMADNITGWMGVIGALSALHYRNQTGKGQHVDSSILDAILYTSDMGIVGAANADFYWPRSGSRHPTGAPANAYSCRDDYVVLVAALDSHWAKLCRLMGREDLIDDPRTNTVGLRAKNVDFIDEVVGAWTGGRTVNEVVKALDELQIVVAPVLSFSQILENEHIRERGMVVEVDHPAAGRLKIYGVGPKLSLTPGKVRAPAPMLGQHNIEVYGTLLSYSKDRITELEQEGVI